MDSITEEKQIESHKLEAMTGGWFVGNFEPTVIKTDAVEVGVKYYKKGTSEKRHYHKVARELTVIVSGKVEMDGKVYSKGDIVDIPAGVASDFRALEDTVTTVVKLPGALNDKYFS